MTAPQNAENGGLDRFFPGNSAMANRMRQFDWSDSPLGPPETWPQTLKTSVRIILTSRHPMFLWWGDQLINLYNDAYAALLHAKHPAALCRPAAAVWPEIWDQVGPQAELAMHRLEGTYDEALPFVIYRKGYAEETYATFSYTPIPNDEGGFGGILCPVTEETERIIGERQMALLRDLAARTGSARTCEKACELVASAMETDPDDLPFALIYLIDSEKRVARLSGNSSVSRGSEAAPESVHLDSPCIWPLEQVWRNRLSLRVSDLGTVSDKLPLVRKQYPVTETIAIPILSSGAGPGGVLIAGLSPLRSFDHSYSQFLDLVAGGVSAAITNGQAYEAERQRTEALAEIDRASLSGLTNDLIASRHALRRREEHLAESERISHTGSCAWNTSTGELVWSEEHCRIFGVPPDQQRQTRASFLNKVYHEDREFVGRAVDLAAEQRTGFDLEYRIVRPDGRIRHIHALCRPAEETDRSADFILAVVDITERKKAEQELRRNEAYLAESERLSHTGSWAWNVTTGALFWSEEHYRILGVVPGHDQVPLSEGLQFIHPDDRKAVEEALERAVRDGADFETESRIVRPDGMVRHIHSRGRPVFDSAGGLVEFAGTIIDNTERKQAYEALQKAQADMAHMARVTTMGELAASIAHEVNQPLSAVINDAAACSGWLDRPQPNVSEASAAAARIMEQAMRASEVISRIRSLLKKSQPDKSVVYLNELINEVLTLTQYEILTHNIAAETELANDLLAVRGDPVQLKQVLANLVVNAIEAIRESTGPARRLVIVSRNSAPDEILVAVRDSGVGIDLETTGELFRPFVTHKPEGLGMGLAISRSIIEAHGGRLWATANEWGGATFQLSLPALRAT